MNLEELSERFEGLLKMDGYDDCVAGVCIRFGQEPILIYDHEKVIQKLMGDGMDRDGAEEYFEFNQLGSYMGEQTPAFLIQ